MRVNLTELGNLSILGSMPKAEIRQIRKDHKDFPKLLKEISPCPKLLYYRGDISLLKTRCFSVVGTRRVTPYGKDAVKQIVRELAPYFTIVSGMALGIDALAHRATLDAGGKTIAVLGGGVDDASLYPVENHKLAQDILANGGLIISEYKPGFKARATTFPIRNRIVSGLSKGVLIVEADIKSGSLITAKLALEQNRDVFAVPGSIFSTRSEGPNYLIKRGAKTVTAAKDIIDEYMQMDPLFKDEKVNLSTQDPVEQKILAILDEHGPSSTDTLVRISELEASRILTALSVLEIKGVIKESNGQYRI